MPLAFWTPKKLGVFFFVDMTVDIHYHRKVSLKLLIFYELQERVPVRSRNIRQ